MTQTKAIITGIEAYLPDYILTNDELSTMHNRNPIEMIKSRIKSPESIIEKLYRKDFPISMESVLENINDVAGIRVICSFIDDIYEVAHMLASQDDIKLIEVKDYIKNPKDNGYRSYHMIIEISTINEKLFIALLTFLFFNHFMKTGQCII